MCAMSSAATSRPSERMSEQHRPLPSFVPAMLDATELQALVERQQALEVTKQVLRSIRLRHHSTP